MFFQLRKDVMPCRLRQICEDAVDNGCRVHDVDAVSAIASRRGDVMAVTRVAVVAPILYTTFSTMGLIFLDGEIGSSAKPETKSVRNK
jgi:hypothetical protein